MKRLPIKTTTAGAIRVVRKRFVFEIVSGLRWKDIERSVRSKGRFLGAICENAIPTAATILQITSQSEGDSPTLGTWIPKAYIK